MLKKLAKRITKEVRQAEDYIEQAFIVRTECPSIADLFIDLAKEEIRHAEKLFDAGHDYAAKHKDATHTEIWKWEHRLMMDDILDAKHKISNYRSN